MTAAASAANIKEEPLAEFVINADNSADVLVGGIKKAQISPGGNVVVFDDTGIQIRPVAAGTVSGNEPGKIQISEDGHALTINSATIGRTEDGAFLIATPGTAQLQPLTTAQLAAAAKPPAAEEGGFPVGATDAAGWLYAGKVKGKPLFAAPEDFFGTKAEAEKELKKLERQGIFARIPHKGDLTALYNLKAALGFKETQRCNALKGLHYACYSSSRRFSLVVPGQTFGIDFRDGTHVNLLNSEKKSYRFVRS